MGRCLAGFGRRAEADGGAAGDHRRPLGFFRRFDRRSNRRRIVAVDVACRPARRLEAFHLIDGIRQRQWPVDRNAVVVEQHDQLVQLEVPGERDGFLTDAFHQVAVGSEHIGRVIDDGAAEHGGEVALRDRHADRVGQALAERPGGGFDAGRVAVLRVAGGERAELAEALELVDGHRLVAGEMQQRVQQHRAMAGREHEAVAVGPRRIGRVEFEEAREQHGGDIGRAHGQAGMAGIGLFDRVHCQRPDGIRHAVVIGARARAQAARGQTRRLRGARRKRTFRHRHETGHARHRSEAAAFIERQGTDNMGGR